MKKGQKLKRICSDCNLLKEQVKDSMRESNGKWRCGACSSILWEKTKRKLAASLFDHIPKGFLP